MPWALGRCRGGRGRGRGGRPGRWRGRQVEGHGSPPAAPAPRAWPAVSLRRRGRASPPGPQASGQRPAPCTLCPASCAHAHLRLGRKAAGGCGRVPGRAQPGGSGPGLEPTSRTHVLGASWHPLRPHPAPLPHTVSSFPDTHSLRTPHTFPHCPLHAHTAARPATGMPTASRLGHTWVTPSPSLCAQLSPPLLPCVTLARWLLRVGSSVFSGV